MLEKFPRENNQDFDIDKAGQQNKYNRRAFDREYTSPCCHVDFQLCGHLTPQRSARVFQKLPHSAVFLAAAVW